jgi:formyltetrahydrofolate-dependent phosphoribosylglycinamide formyltransferase
LKCEPVVRSEFDSVETFSERIFELCREAKVDLVILGGFLSLVQIPNDFQHRVINIHPSLIPAFCGKGFHGHHVHEGVLERGAKISGCTVHFANNEYDAGPIILQKVVPVMDDDTPDTLQKRVFEAECEAFPEAIRMFASGRLTVDGSRVATS